MPLKRQHPERIVSIYASGSRVRGDYREWSDIDLLIIVKDKDSRAFKKGKRFRTPFYENIIREGIAL
jgi:predicted nucleotidyltransferase